ncbi:Gx transporter family protein [Nitrospina sp. 32_T5]|uniref:Gx transporter family protein n=1 Tax=unclassified Nitrospina TaxID=2638683 RepID=UPI003F97EF7B
MTATPPPSATPDNRKLVVLAILVGLGVVLHRVEAMLPLPSPWVKLGLANVITLVTLVRYGFSEALTVTVLRIFLGGIFGGTFLGPTFFLSLTGGLAAMAVMGLVHHLGKRWFSLIGVSVSAAYAHTTAIFLCVFFFFIQQKTFLQLLPVFLTFSLLTGILTGVLANHVLERMREENVTVP